MTKAPKVGIVTRTRNRPLLLARAVRSVLEQSSAPDWAHVIVNDGGEAEAVEAVIDPFRNQYGSRLRVLHHEESGGMEAASNAGIAAMDSELLVIHDDDDAWAPDFLSRMGVALGEAQRARSSVRGIVCHSRRVVEEITDQGVVELTSHPFNDWLDAITLPRVLAENPFPPISFLFRRDLYDEVGPFDEGLPVLGDWEFNVRVLLRYDIAVLPEILAYYHHRAGVDQVEYANSITGSDARHREYDRRLRERWNVQFGEEFAGLGAAAVALRTQLELQRGLKNLQQKLDSLRSRVQEEV